MVLFRGLYLTDEPFCPLKVNVVRLCEVLQNCANDSIDNLSRLYRIAQRVRLSDGTLNLRTSCLPGNRQRRSLEDSVKKTMIALLTGVLLLSAAMPAFAGRHHRHHHHHHHNTVVITP